MKGNGMLKGWIKRLTVVGMVLAAMLPVCAQCAWNDVVTHRYAGSGWETLSLNYAYDAGDGWLWLPEAGVWIYLFDVEEGDPVPEGFVLVEGGTLSTTNTTLNGTAVATFLIGQYEVTWGEWQTVSTYAAANGYDIGSVGAGCADDHPVHSVSWYDVLKWCNLKSQMDDLTPVYTVGGAVFMTGQPDLTTISQNLSANGYRLPLEAEWEFAARGGNQTNGYAFSGSNDLNSVGWYSGNSGGAACNLSVDRGTWPVGQKAANELGLYDMSGNVSEKCWDRWSGMSSIHVIRGGSWINPASFATVSYRNSGISADRGNISGFRLARRPAN